MPKATWRNLVTLQLQLNSEIKNSLLKVFIYNDIVLFQPSQSLVDSITKKNKVLNDRQKNWNVDQKTLQKEKNQRKINEHRKEGEYITKLL